jgi:predicted RNA-binding protein YlxR (DUF448 family)
LTERAQHTGPERTCAGCGRPDAQTALVRLVASEGGEVSVDLDRAAPGRGSYVHPLRSCLASAARGVKKSFRRSVAFSAAELASRLGAAARQRVDGMLRLAVRSKQALLEAQAARAWELGQAHLLVVARDASDEIAALGDVIAQGGAVAWGTKAELGGLTGRSQLAVLGIASRSLAEAIRLAAAMASVGGDDGASPTRAPTVSGPNMAARRAAGLATEVR